MMIPDIYHFGHACTGFRYRGVLLMSDPWFYPAFLASWFPYPNNRDYLESALDCDYIYLSHAHEDHFDREFLRQIDITRTSMIIPRFRSRFLEREVTKLFPGFPPVVLGHGESTVLPRGIKLTMLLDRSHKEDSALLVETPDFRFLNSNDCLLSAGDWPKDIDLLACQFSGAFWYPHCYDFSPDEQVRKAAEIRDSNFRRLCQRIRLTGAKNYLPSAGPPVFLDPELAAYNRAGGIFPRWEEVAHVFRKEFPDVGIWPYLRHFTDLAAYRERRRDEWGAWYGEPDTEATADEVSAHFCRLQQLNKRFLRNWEKDVGLSSGGCNWQVRLGLLRGELEEAFSPEYVLDLPPRVLRAVLDGRATWETALLSMRVRLHRDPDIYDNTLMGLLAFGDRPVQTLTMAGKHDSGETIERQDDLTGDTYRMQRWCAHAGEAMSAATVHGGVVTCARHGWRWDARTGECLSGQGLSMRTGKCAPLSSSGTG